MFACLSWPRELAGVLEVAITALRAAILACSFWTTEPMEALLRPAGASVSAEAAALPMIPPARAVTAVNVVSVRRLNMIVLVLDSWGFRTQESVSPQRPSEEILGVVSSPPTTTGRASFARRQARCGATEAPRNNELLQPPPLATSKE